MESGWNGDPQDTDPATRKSSPSLSFQIRQWSKSFKTTVADMALPSSNHPPPPPQPTAWGSRGGTRSQILEFPPLDLSPFPQRLWGRGLWKCSCPLLKVAAAFLLSWTIRGTPDRESSLGFLPAPVFPHRGTSGETGGI